MRDQNAVSIVVPTLNEEGNIMPLLARIDSSLKAAGIVYEVIFIDDHSTDNTYRIIRLAARDYPIRYEQKRGNRGKANSLQQGFPLAFYDVICMIDADLQYPPEAIVDMLQLLHDNNSDIVITSRNEHMVSFVRKLSTRIFNYLFVKLLFGFDYDTQSGLKLFRKEILKTINLTPGKWSFDLEFIVRSLEDNYRILSYEIPFAERHSGEAKINLISATYDLITQSIKLRATSSGKILRKAYRTNVLFMQQSVDVVLVLLISAVLASAAAHAPHTAALAVSDPINVIMNPMLTPITQLVLPMQPGNAAGQTAAAQGTGPSSQPTNPSQQSSTTSPQVAPSVNSAATPTGSEQISVAQVTEPNGQYSQHGQPLEVRSSDIATVPLASSYPGSISVGKQGLYSAQAVTINTSTQAIIAKLFGLVGLVLLGVGLAVRNRIKSERKTT
jgi:dolichol-phosphate mannosyltransferase